MVVPKEARDQRPLGRPEGEDGGELAVEMGGEALGGRQGGRRVEEPPEAREQAPAGHGRP